MICFDDAVYGHTCFTEPLLEDLYHSQAVQRLAHIYQGGITAFIKPQRNTTRLEHSLGVAALLRRLGADVVEQAAGLVHDVAHTALSHVVDFVYPNREHTYHEAHREAMIAATDLPTILDRHGLDWRWLTNADHFPLLEQPLPHLCADRLDYFLRDGVADVGAFDREAAQALLAHLRVWEGRIVVDDLEAARWLAEQFIHLDDVCWCSVQEMGWYGAVAQALRLAMERGLLSREEFAGTDAALVARLRAINDAEIQRWLNLLRPDVDFAVVDGGPPSPYDIRVLPKVRTIDPPVLLEGRVVPLSRLDSAFVRYRDAYIAAKAPIHRLRPVGHLSVRRRRV